MLHAADRRRFVGPVLVVSLAAAALGFAFAEAPEAPKLVVVAPAADLTAAAEAYFARVKTMLADEASFAANKDQLAQKANAIVALVQVIGNIEGDGGKLKPNAAATMAAARELSRATDFAAAKAALDALSAAWGKSDNAAPPTLEKTASLGKLMHESEEVNARIRRNLRRFERTKDDSLQAAAALSAFAQASIYDTHEVKNPADLPKWYAMATEMRDAATALSESARAGDEAAFKTGLDRLSKSCETCHEVFHNE